jgi:hypothetical protein
MTIVAFEKENAMRNSENVIDFCEGYFDGDCTVVAHPGGITSLLQC